MSKDPARLETLMKAAYKRINALEAELDALRRASHGPIAVIGVGCRFPGAENPEAFWQMLLRGDDAVTLPAPTRGSAAASNVSAGFLEQVDLFDSLFFRISPREALYIDPAQRLLLEVTWEALEHAGIPPHRLVNSPTGVFVGQMATAQPVDLQTAQALVPAPDDQAGQIYAMTGGLAGFAPGRLSYFLGVQGPSMAIDCSCSAALMSVHQAVNSLRRGECTLAIAGGVHLLPTPAMVAEWTSWPLFTAGGRCKTCGSGWVWLG
jgi:acyl transferase domain-containing protein